MYTYTQEKSGKTSERKLLSPGKIDTEAVLAKSFHTRTSSSEAPSLALVQKVGGSNLLGASAFECLFWYVSCRNIGNIYIIGKAFA